MRGMHAQGTMQLLALARRSTLRTIAGVSAGLLGVVVWAILGGYTERAVYLGVVPTAATEVALLRTYPERNYRMPRGAELAELRIACRYDFTYAPSFGPRPAGERMRLVRKAMLVDCP